MEKRISHIIKIVYRRSGARLFSTAFTFIHTIPANYCYHRQIHEILFSIPALRDYIWVMNEKFVTRISKEVEEVKASGLYKTERIITSPQGAEITVNGKTVLNFCANNYLGLSSNAKVIEAAHQTLSQRGYGMSSVRFI